MIRIAAASYEYVKEYLSDNQGTYLDSSQALPPFHGGKMAPYFGFNGEYDRHAFLQSMDGNFRIDGSKAFTSVRYHGSGEKVNANGEQQKLDPAIEVLVSPPKSWSAAIHFAKGEEKERLQSILASAMKAAMEKMEDLATTRITDDKVTTNEKVAGLSWTAFPHDSTRRGDMDNHFHLIVNKLTRGLDGEIRTIDLASVIRIQYEMDAFLKTELARLGAAAGYELRMTANGPELAQMSERLLKAFSTARAEMEELLKQSGIDIEHATSSQKAWANLSKRLAKIQFDESFVEATNRAKLADEGIDYDSIVVGAEREGYTLTAPRRAVEAVYMAMQDVHEREDVIKSRHVLALLASKYSDFSIPGHEISAAIDQLIDSRELMFRVDPVNGRITAQTVTLTSRFAVERERASAGYWRNAVGRGGAITSLEASDEAIAAVEAIIQSNLTPDANGVVPTVSLTKGQRDMVHAALGVTHDHRITCVQGDPGTGKTSGMQAVRIAAEQAGWKVVGLAPSDKARDELTSAGVEAETIQLATKSAKWWKSVDAKTVIILDEAGMVDSRTMNILLEKSQAAGARVVAIGDTKQMLSVEAGTPFGRMCKLAADGNSYIEMTEMNRGRTADMKALHVLSRDDQASAIRKIMKGGPAGKAAFFSEKADQYAFVADKVAGLTFEQRISFAVVVDRNIDRIHVNNAIRARLGLETTFTMASFEANQDLTRPAHLLASSYAQGDAIRMNRANGPYGKGTILEVQDVVGGRVMVKNKNGELSQFVPDIHGQDATLGELEALALGKGDLVRMAAKWDSAGLRNGDRAIVREIDADGRAIFDVINVDGRITSTVDVDLTSEGISVRSGYSTTVNGLQGGSVDFGIYLASSSNRNQFLVALTRFKHALTLVADGTTQDRLEAMILRAQTPHIKDSALPTKAEQQQKLRRRAVNAAWSHDPELTHQKPDFIPFPKKGEIKNASHIEDFLKLAEKRFGNARITGNKAFIEQCQDVAREAGKQDVFSFAVQSSRQQGSLKTSAAPQAAVVAKESHQAPLASAARPRM